MANSEKRKSGGWTAMYRDSSGRRRSAGTFTHKAKADRAGAAAEDDARRNLWSDRDSGRRTWGKWADVWFPSRGVELSTAHVDAGRRAKHLDPRWSDVPLGAIRRQDVKSWAADMRAAGIGASTVQRIVHLLSASLAAAVDAEIIEANPAARIVLPKGAQAVERFLKRDEFEKLLDAAETTDDRLIMSTLVYTGMRWGELAGLHTNRLDTERGLIQVVEAFDGMNRKIKPYPKGRAIRTVPIDGWLAELLAARTPVPCTVPHIDGRCSGFLVFSTEGGAVLDGSKWGKRFRKAVGVAGIGHTRIHDLRHTYASWLLHSGQVSIEEVGQLMGHDSTETTKKYRGELPPKNDNVLTALRRTA